MWPYAARLAIEALNNTPSDAVPGGVSSQQLLLEHMNAANPIPNFHSFRQYREAGWCHIPAERCAMSVKFDERSTKIHYVGRIGSRIHLM
jgi:hypothetical protein